MDEVVGGLKEEALELSSEVYWVQSISQSLSLLLLFKKQQQQKKH